MALNIPLPPPRPAAAVGAPQLPAAPLPRANPMRGLPQIPLPPIRPQMPAAMPQAPAIDPIEAIKSVLGGGPNEADTYAMAQAAQAYKETGDPWSAFANGWINASAARDEFKRAEAEAAETKAEKEAAKAAAREKTEYERARDKMKDEMEREKLKLEQAKSEDERRRSELMNLKTAAEIRELGRKQGVNLGVKESLEIERLTNEFAKRLQDGVNVLEPEQIEAKIDEYRAKLTERIGAVAGQGGSGTTSPMDDSDVEPEEGASMDGGWSMTGEGSRLDPYSGYPEDDAGADWIVQNVPKGSYFLWGGKIYEKTQ